jgi:hypothetical protein
VRVWPKNLVITHTVQHPLLWWPSMKTTGCLSFYHLLLCRYVFSDCSEVMEGGVGIWQATVSICLYSCKECAHTVYQDTTKYLQFICYTIVTLGNGLQATFQHTLLLIFITGLQLIQCLYCFSKHRGLCWRVPPAGLSISLVCLLISLLIFIFCR